MSPFRTNPSPATSALSAEPWQRMVDQIQTTLSLRTHHGGSQNSVFTFVDNAAGVQEVLQEKGGRKA